MSGLPACFEHLLCLAQAARHENLGNHLFGVLLIPSPLFPLLSAISSVTGNHNGSAHISEDLYLTAEEQIVTCFCTFFFFF